MTEPQTTYLWQITTTAGEWVKSVRSTHPKCSDGIWYFCDANNAIVAAISREHLIAFRQKDADL